MTHSLPYLILRVDCKGKAVSLHKCMIMSVYVPIGLLQCFFFVVMSRHDTYT